MTGNRLFIGKVAKRAGVNPKTIRYYETVGLLPPAPRGENRYRLYPYETIELLLFIAKAKDLGFTLAEIREIVTIRQQGRQPCSHVRSIVQRKVADLDQMLTDLIGLRRRLKRLVAGWKARGRRPGAEAVVCPHIEGEKSLGTLRRRDTKKGR
jgi:DNA-binding transcriptional MerR regulator